MTQKHVFLFLTGLLIFGVALILLVIRGFASKPRPQWFNQKNIAFLADDLLFGAILILLGLNVLTASWIYWVSLISTFLSHAWRDAEFVAYFPNRFCDKPSLFVVNNLKLMGLLSTAMLH